MSITFAVDDIIQVTPTFGLVGKVDRFVNVLHYRVKEITGLPPFLPDILTAIGTDIETRFVPLWQAAASQNARWISVGVQSVFPVPRSARVDNFPAGAALGALDDEAMPAQDSPTLLKRTEFGTRWGLGRLFFFGITEGMQEDGILNNAAVAALSAYTDAVEANSVVTIGGFTATLEPVLIRGPVDNPTSVTKILRVELSDEVIKTQRRRRPGKGS